jgi:hypothetical protein
MPGLIPRRGSPSLVLLREPNSQGTVTDAIQALGYTVDVLEIDSRQPPFRVYAEVLQNTRSATLVVMMDETTYIDKVYISGEGRSAVFNIDNRRIADERITVELPVPMREGDPVDIDLQDGSYDDFSVRLVMQPNPDQPDGPSPVQRQPAWMNDNVVPWGADRMNELRTSPAGTYLACRWCDWPLVPLESVQGWRDLPREGWEESLDIWHCHRPHERAAGADGGCADDHGGRHNGVLDAGPSRPHPATNRVRIASGVGYVGLLYFLLDGRDCRGNVQVRDAPFHFFQSSFPSFPQSVPGGKEGGFYRSAAPDHGKAFDTTPRY